MIVSFGAIYCQKAQSEISAFRSVRSRRQLLRWQQSFELFKSFAEVIWGGGDIDPRPLEKAVRAAFGRSGRTAK